MTNRKIIILIRLIVIMIAGLTFSIAAQTKQTSKSVAKPLPNLVLDRFDGEKWSLEENRGSITLLNFWATWCAPCRAEIPILVNLSDKYKADGLKIVGVSVDSENKARIAEFVDQYKINYPIVLTNPGSLLSRQKAVPMSLLIDKKGVLAKKYVGAVDANILEKDIKVLVAKKEGKVRETPGKARKVKRKAAN